MRNLSPELCPRFHIVLSSEMARLYYILGILLFCFSCKKELVDQVSLAPTNILAPIVIEGGVNTFTAEQYIYLTVPSYNLNQAVMPVDDAKVFINETELKLTSASGVYSAILSDNKQYGMAYRLKVSYHNLIFEAIDTLHKVNPVATTALNTNFRLEDGKYTISFPRHVFNGRIANQLFYRFPGTKAWRPDLFKERQSLSFIHTYAPPYGLVPALEQRTEYQLLPSDKIDLYQFSLSGGYQRYLYELFQETDWKSLFSANPGSPKGNISSGALGYFYCTDVTVQSIVAGALIK